MVKASLKVKYTTNYRHVDEWDMESLIIDPETLESYVEDIIGFGWIPQTYDSSPVGRKVRFEDDEGFELFMFVRDNA